MENISKEITDSWIQVPENVELKEDLIESNSKPIEFKRRLNVLFCGTSGVGKSSVIKQVLMDQFQETEEDCPKTDDFCEMHGLVIGDNPTGETQEFTLIDLPSSFKDETGKEFAVTLVDSPGIGGLKGKVENLAAKYEAMRNAKEQNSEGFNINMFIFCLEATNFRIGSDLNMYQRQLFLIGKKPEDLFNNLFFQVTKVNEKKNCNVQKIFKAFEQGLVIHFEKEPEFQKLMEFITSDKRTKPLFKATDDINAAKQIYSLLQINKNSKPIELIKLDDEELYEQYCNSNGFDSRDLNQCNKFKKEYDELVEKNKKEIEDMYEKIRIEKEAIEQKIQAEKEALEKRQKDLQDQMKKDQQQVEQLKKDQKQADQIRQQELQDQKREFEEDVQLKYFDYESQRRKDKEQLDNRIENLNSENIGLQKSIYENKREFDRYKNNRRSGCIIF